MVHRRFRQLETSKLLILILGLAMGLASCDSVHDTAPADQMTIPAPIDVEGLLVWRTSTLPEAAELSSMSILVRPEGSDGPLLETVRFAPLSTPGRSVLHLHYADGVDIVQWPAQGGINPVLGGQSLGVIKSDAVDLDGIAASGFGSGSAVDGRTGETISYSGQLEWEAGGIYHIIYADLPLEGLTAVARSLQPAVLE